MLTTWMPMVVPLIVTVLWLWLPGVPIAIALKLRPATVWAFSPLLSVALIALAAIVAPMVGLAWGPLPAALTIVPVWCAAWAVRLLVPRALGHGRPQAASKGSPEVASATGDPARAEAKVIVAPPAGSRGLASRLRSIGTITAGSFVLAALLMSRHVRNVLDRPDALSQTFDNIFHQNAVRWILDTGDASSLHLLAMTATPGDPTFYPAAWHDIVSLLLISTGLNSIPTATNALVIAATCLVWTAGSVLLLRTVLPSSLVRLGLPLGAVLTASFPTFPVLFMKFGVLYPNLLGLCLLPAMLVLALRFAGLARREHISIPALVVAGLLGAVALSLAHPNASMSFVVMVIPISLAGGIRALARARSPQVRGGLAPGLLLLVAAGAAWGIAHAIWPLIRPPAAALTWPPTMDTAAALGQAILVNPMEGIPRWILAVLVVVGLVRCVQRGDFALPLTWGVVVYLWLAIASWPDGEARTALVGVWYNDPYRIAAVLTVPCLPLAAIGAAHIARLIEHHLAPRTFAWRGPVVGVVTTAALIWGTQATPWMNLAVHEASSTYELSDHSALLTEDEYDLIERVPELVPADSVIVTDAWNGSSLVYAYTGRRTTTRHTLEYHSQEVTLLNDRLDEAEEDPSVCNAVKSLDAGYVLDFGDQQINHSTAPHEGFDDLQYAEGFTLIASDGNARLYRIDACSP